MNIQTYLDSPCSFSVKNQKSSGIKLVYGIICMRQKVLHAWEISIKADTTTATTSRHQQHRLDYEHDDMI